MSEPFTSELRRFRTEQLIEELARRANAEPVERPEHWCHDCLHFVAWNERPRTGEMPEDFNPCTKGHTMRFIAPKDYGDEYGHYLRVCADRLLPSSDPNHET